ncbi:MICOS complex subunit MIC27 [Poecilia latipinna]|uniref:MICOS complex subunit n=1 Tax=Poecilia latipinna TaxID=48699 RepID=A0A3B3VXG5_9TELE|nr:PREDICTED: MICOS complex subunit MIC27-like [Poecilia latipinna]XP_014907505.1 PREDICTED: MICOS complex subunit MIC27-like [Poecilia latipinna]
MAGADRFKAAKVSIGRRRGRIAVMAAKVAMVAVPTVLGIASIRVYTVKDAPADGLVSRDRLNVYAPLPSADPPKVVPESPGLIERGLTTTRESVLPAVRAVKGACVSVKRSSVNLYHAGEDVYYYLIDPPPGFLPRFGTVTMAGLLGMFLTRKGSRFKRLAVPLGLMSAGASVCYPAQAVSVLKVTGQKVYAAGQWSAAAASSLLAAREPVAKEAAASQTQPPSEADPESALRQEEASADLSTPDLLAKSAAVLETEVESAESVPISDEPAATEEPPVALTGISPAERGWSADLEPVQTEPSRPASDAAADGNRASDDVSLDATPAATVQDKPAEGDLPSAPAVESAAEFEPAEEQQSLPAVEETPTSTLVTPPPPAEGSREEGSGFQPDPALMDFGQSSPEDEDLYSTRS